MDNIETSQDNLTTSPVRTRRGAKGIPIEKILELKKKDLTHEQIAELVGCDKSNVTRRLAPYKETIAGLERFKNHRADILAWNQGRLLNAITERDIKDASLLQKTTAVGILYDKERLERGKSTENVSIKSITEHYSTELSKAQEALKALVDDP